MLRTYVFTLISYVNDYLDEHVFYLTSSIRFSDIGMTVLFTNRAYKEKHSLAWRSFVLENDVGNGNLQSKESSDHLEFGENDKKKETEAVF